MNNMRLSNTSGSIHKISYLHHGLITILRPKGGNKLLSYHRPLCPDQQLNTDKNQKNSDKDAEELLGQLVKKPLGPIGAD